MTDVENFWNTRYLQKETGWDMQQVSPPLKYFIDRITDKGLPVLIPGCGNAYEAAYMLDQGFTHMTLIDISAHLVDTLRERFDKEPIEIIHRNFFEHQGKYDLILEQTFFCAILPEQRLDYVKKAHELLNAKGRIAGVLFNENFGYEDHPPFAGSEAEYRKLFEPYFKIVRMEPCEISIQPRLGNELLIELEKNETVEEAT